MEPTRRPGFIKLIGAVLVSACLAGSVARAQTEAKLQIDSEEFDFGLVPDNSMLVYRTWLRSVGEDTLEIRDVKTGCSCLTTPLKKSRLAPGDSTLLILHWRVGAAGSRAERTPYLFSNDDRAPHRMLLRAEVVADKDRNSPVSCRPTRIQFGEAEKRRDFRKVFTIRNSTDTDLAVTPISGPEDAFTLELPDSVPAGSAGTGVVILTEEFAEEKYERSFTLELKGGEDSIFRLSVPVTRGDFSFRPTLTTSIDK